MDMARATDSRERLIQATLDLIHEQNLATTSVDAICERSGVKKGSFYYFFKSKADLVTAAFEDYFESVRPEYDRMFSATLPPVERLRNYFEFMSRRSHQRKEKLGRVTGCIFTNVGCSCSQEDEPIRAKAQEILGKIFKCFETAIRDGQQDGSIPVKDAKASAEVLFDYIEGVIATARIKNDLSHVDRMGLGAFALLGLEWDSSRRQAVSS
jgi:TetR/AcrR family transcriptional repressor of nem operon